MRSRLVLLSLSLFMAAGCSRSIGRVEYVGGQCRVDGSPIDLHQVESRQAQVTEHILARQPLFALVTVLVLVLAGMSHVEKLVLLFSTRKSGARGFGERLKLALDRYRAHPIRYFTIVLATLTLLGAAAGLYIYLDVDKRASERALGMLQFCHLALRTADEQGVLDQQRANLQAIQSTASDIRGLVNKLPPDEQRKARQIIEQMNTALGQQSQLMSDYVERSEAAVKEHTAAVERGLSSVQAGVLELKSLPQSVRDVGEQVHKLDGRLGGIDGKLGAVEGRLGSVDNRLATFDARLAALDNSEQALAEKLVSFDARLGGRPVDAPKPPPAPASTTRATPPDGGVKPVAGPKN